MLCNAMYDTYLILLLKLQNGARAYMELSIIFCIVIKLIGNLNFDFESDFSLDSLTRF